MTKRELSKRYFLFILGLLFSGIGVAITKRGELGVSPISSVANVVSYKMQGFTLGTWLLIWNCVLLFGQILVLRSKFQMIQFLQIPLSVLFGWFTDFGLWISSYLPNSNYAIRLLLVIAGIVILAFGISLTVIANVVMNSGEAFVKAVSDQTGKTFGNVKIAFDVSCVVLAIILSLLFFDFKVIGTREGTILAALLTGTMVKWCQKRMEVPVNQVLRA
ncbi:MAG TPA: hypothetical protein DCW90_25055 [Lachnospiraceae bacterium]|nr:DUF6198 family protein [uncultured Lachnoclostridium sp.]HAU88623.1 hypothetical protein [Lachnospiraceae bacterium]